MALARKPQLQITVTDLSCLRTVALYRTHHTNNTQFQLPYNAYHPGYPRFVHLLQPSPAILAHRRATCDPLCKVYTLRLVCVNMAVSMPFSAAESTVQLYTTSPQAGGRTLSPRYVSRYLLMDKVHSQTSVQTVETTSTPNIQRLATATINIKLFKIQQSYDSTFKKAN
jgi:hypothetical protein